MSHLPRTLPLIAMLAICSSRCIAVGHEMQPEVAFELRPNDNRSCVFANDKARFLYSAAARPGDAAKNVDWQVDWSLVAGNRTLTRGSGKALVPGDSDIPQYVVEIPTPPLRTSVVLPAEMRVTWIADGRKYQHNRPLYMFSRDPFAAQQALWEYVHIKLFDADGKTAILLDENEIPHSRLLNLSAIDLVTEGIVLVGEGVSFRKQRKLPESLLRAAQRGVPVLCLAPSEGDFPLAIRRNGQPVRPSRLELERGDIVRRYDKRFDEIRTVCHLSLESRRNEVVISAANGKDDWSWLNMEFPAEAPGMPSGRLIICGLGIVSLWDTSPVPRYLFVHLLEELTRARSTSEDQEDAFTQR